MALSDREDEILKLLQKHKSFSIKKLAQLLFISEPTARRDVIAMAEKGWVLRTHGGVVLNSSSPDKKISIYQRLGTMNENKKRIAEQAAALIKDGTTIAIDSSSSAFHLLPFLSAKKDLIVFTNSIKVITVLIEMDITAYIIGGKITQETMSCTGADAIDMIKHYNIDICFFSCDGLSSEGMLSDNSVEETEFRKSLIRQSKTAVALIDNSKLNKKFWINFCSLSEIDYCFSDLPIPEHLQQMLRASGGIDR